MPELAKEQYARWRHALALTESSDNPHAWGDQGLACGRWQMHPAFVWDYGPDDVAVRASWDAVFAATLISFYADRSQAGATPLKIAMEFHLGVAAVAAGHWDEPYAERFAGFYGVS